jgi:hypothetical protein
VYPRGTPLDALDVDLLDTPSLQEGDIGNFIPSILIWDATGGIVTPEVIIAMVGYPRVLGPTSGIEYRTGPIAYKTYAEAWLDTLHYEYLVDLARSPLERGKVMSHPTFLHTCFRKTADGGTETSRKEAPVPQVSAVPFEPEITFTSPQNLIRRNMVSQSDPTETVTRWNALDEQLAAQVSRIQDHEPPPLSFNDPKMIQLFLRLWRKLRDDDARNLPLERVAAMVKLSSQDVLLLEEAGVKNLKGFAEALFSSPGVERRTKELNESIAKMDDRTRCRFDLKPIEYPLTSQDAKRMSELIGAALENEDESDGGYDEDVPYEADDSEKPNKQV